MRVYTVLAIYDGVPAHVEVFGDPELARRRGLELAEEFELLQEPPDWHDYDEWNSEAGSTRFWQHHWYDNQRDVVVAKREVH